MGWLRRLSCGVWLILLFLPVPALAAEPDLPSPTAYVTDLAGILDAGTRQRLTQIIEEVRQRTTAEIAVLTVQTTAPQTIEEYSVAIYDRWKIGQRGKDNGLLFLVAAQDRRMRITTGYGLEGILPDGKVGEIRDREILPHFRAGRYAEGILQGTEALARVIVAQGEHISRGRQPVRGSTGILLGIFILLVLFVIGVSAMERRAFRRARGRVRPGGFRQPRWIDAGLSGGIGGWSGGGFSAGSFGGFGGGSTGGGGAGGSW